jgi:xanthine/uracil/vitamin C permease (AzgA family)
MFGFTQLIMSVIPKSVKVSTIVGMGIQIALVGLTSINLIVGMTYT